MDFVLGAVGTILHPCGLVCSQGCGLLRGGFSYVSPCPNMRGGASLLALPGCVLSEPSENHTPLLFMGCCPHQFGPEVQAHRLEDMLSCPGEGWSFFLESQSRPYIVGGRCGAMAALPLCLTPSAFGMRLQCLLSCVEAWAISAPARLTD